ncbi:MAG: NUDIX hydrolase [Pseudanabaenaceae cyanobacterium bins.68]|nr:NUDIX hydrolase [Pseudanabaenaceae cyanobacterium bins.68]
MGYSPTIRVLALGVICDRQRVFMSEGHDPVKGQTFYRALGGGIDFGESSAAALVREFKEELDTEVVNLSYLGCLENLFSFNGQPGHEIIQLYSCEFQDPKFYQLEQIEFAEGARRKLALWVDINRFLSGELILYPDGMTRYLGGD